MTDQVQPQYQVQIRAAEGDVLAVTHIRVRRCGSQILCSFVFDDELSEPSGFSGTAGTAIAAHLVGQVNALKLSSAMLQQMEKRQPQPLPEPKGRFRERHPPFRISHVVGVASDAARTVYVAFPLVDPYQHFPFPGVRLPSGPVPVPAVKVAMDPGAFMDWSFAVKSAAEDGA